ncbi:ABC transporter permease [Hoyosella rhizosphaerae]|uniref:ABC transporter permease n=1 Tax=Hoyosella rhizosphaerae TaxID=1755582 RepID=A0A916XFW3_9ACTN|nr:ABC transporter permease [Hoyosella rhizosphaerae]
MIPALFLVVFFAWPVVAIMHRGFVDTTGAFDPGGTLAILMQPSVWSIAAFTVGQAAASTVLTLAVGLPIAWMLARVDIPGRTLLRVLVTVPFVLPTVVVGITFRALFAQDGPLGFLGLDGTVWAILIAHVFFNVAVVARTVGSVWAHLDPRAELAARTLGASPLRAWWTVTVPALRPAITSAAAVVFLFCATSFGVVLVLGGSRYRTLETEIYLQTVQVFDLRTAAALSLLQMATIAVAIAVATLSRPGRKQSMSLRPMTATSRKPQGTQWCGVAAVLALIGVVLVLPPVLLIIRSLRRRGEWSLEGYRLLFSARAGTNGFEAAALSIRTATDAAILALTMGVLAAIAVSRLQGRYAWIADGAILLPLGISAVTVGFGILITLGHLPGDLRRSALIVPIAQALIATPLVVRVVLPALRSVGEHLRDSAAILGASPARVWWSVDFPLVARSIAAAAGFAFVIALGEFGATSFLARASEPTLPVLIGRLIARPGVDNVSMALSGAVVLLALTAAVIAIVEVARIRDIGEF